MKAKVLLISLIFCSYFIFAQGPFTPTDSLGNSQSDWVLTLSPYALLASQATDVGGEQLRQSFNDLSSLTNFGFQANVAIQYKGKYRLYFDGTFANLGASTKIAFADVNLDIVQYIIDNRFEYQFYSDIDYTKEGNVVRGWSMAGSIGAKYWRNDVKVNYDLGFGEEFKGELRTLQQWWDLMLGVNARIILSKTVLLGLSGSGGGFGIGNSSKFTFDFIYSNTFKISKHTSISAGYRTFRYDREDDGLSTRVSVFGPFVGASFMIF